MRYARMLKLAVAAAALMTSVGAGAASATEITCGASTHSKCAMGQVIHAESIGKVVYDAPYGNVECQSTIAGSVSSAGSASETSKVDVTTLDMTNCGGDTFVTLAKGSLEVHTEQPSGTNTGNGILTSTGTRITQVHLGVHCIFETNNTAIGTITGSTNTGGHAVLHIKATIPRVGGGGGIFCGSSTPWTGAYTFTTPKVLVIH